MTQSCYADLRGRFDGAIDTVETVLVHTGQHYDTAMSDVFFDELGLRRPDRSLGVGSGTHAEQTARVMLAFEPLIADLAPDVVVVVGDVNSTLACSVVAAKGCVPIAHVEAGLRSGDWTMPEEVNRVLTDRLARYLLAPLPDAVENLRQEGEPDSEIHLVGNVMIDTLLANVGRDPGRILAEAIRVLEEGVPARRPELWDGKAADRIAQTLTAG